MITQDISRYPGGFANGVSIRGLPILNTYAGNVFWVDYTHGSNASNKTGSAKRPWKTLTYALARCTNDHGDVIMLAPGHAETITSAGGIAANKSGVTIIGIGSGDLQPTFTFTTAAAASITASAANVTWVNCRFLCNIANQNHMFDVTASGICWDLCYFSEGTATGKAFITADTTDNDSDNLVIRNCEFYAPTSGNYDHAVSLGKDHDNWLIENNIVYGDFDDSCIEVPAGGSAATNLRLFYNKLTNLQADDHAIQINGTGVTGMAVGNKLQTNAQGTAFDSSALACHDNTWADTDGSNDEEAVPVNPLIDSLTNFIGVDDNNNLASTGNVAANEDGSILERLEQIQEATNKGTGTALPSNKSIYDEVKEHGNGYYAEASITINGSTVYSMFQVSGAVLARVWGEVVTPLTSHADKAHVGVSGQDDCLLASTGGSVLDTTGLVWTTATPAWGVAEPSRHIITAGEDIKLYGTANLASGAILFRCFYQPLTTDSTLVAG